MFALDSDILGIVMALLTFLVPLLSALVGKKRKGKGESADAEQEDPIEERREELEEMFSLILGGESGKEPDVVPAGKVEIEPEILQETVEETKVEPAAGAVASAAAEAEVEDTRKSLKQRLKDNPEDMILFSEILKPKFKEY